MNKKAFELSATVIVILIITIVIFVGGIFFIKKFFAGAQEIKGEIERSTQDQIESLLREGGVVAIPLNTKTLNRGQSDVFGLGIRNIGRQDYFYVFAEFYQAFEPDGKTEIFIPDKDFITNNWLLYATEPFDLLPNKFALRPISVFAGNTLDGRISTPPGTYIFNVCVYKGDSLGYCNLDDFVNSADGFAPLYSKKVYQMFIEIPA